MAGISDSLSDRDVPAGTVLPPSEKRGQEEKAAAIVEQTVHRWAIRIIKAAGGDTHR